MNALKNKDDDERTNTGTGWLVAKEESESYIMTTRSSNADVKLNAKSK
jgi:hypothetical protein